MKQNLPWILSIVLALLIGSSIGRMVGVDAASANVREQCDRVGGVALNKKAYIC